MRKAGIYQIINNVDGKCYVGSAINLKRRWQDHRKLLRGNRHHCKYLQNAWNKYGEKKFIFEVLENVYCDNNLIKLEQAWLDFLNPEYNTVKIAGNNSGLKWSLICFLA